jgi:hypothetical protein
VRAARPSGDPYLLLFILVVCAAAAVGSLAIGTPAAGALPARPSFVVIQTDDETLDELYTAYEAFPGPPALRAIAAHDRRDRQLIFTPENGFFFGEHRLTGGKFLACEPSTRLPLLIRGPGIRPNSKTGEIAANVDVAPTVLELAGERPRRERRRALALPYAHDSRLRTRRPILFESFVQTNDVEENGGGAPASPPPA